MKEGLSEAMDTVVLKITGLATLMHYASYQIGPLNIKEMEGISQILYESAGDLREAYKDACEHYLNNGDGREENEKEGNADE